MWFAPSIVQRQLVHLEHVQLKYFAHQDVTLYVMFLFVSVLLVVCIASQMEHWCEPEVCEHENYMPFWAKRLMVLLGKWTLLGAPGIATRSYVRY